MVFPGNDWNNDDDSNIGFVNMYILRAVTCEKSLIIRRIGTT